MGWEVRFTPVTYNDEDVAIGLVQAESAATLRGVTPEKRFKLYGYVDEYIEPAGE
jgi:hypothetical protein